MPAEPAISNTPPRDRVPAALDRWSRLAPLTGVLFVILVVIGGPVLAGSTPGAHASGQSVIEFFSAHRERQRAAAIILAFAFVAFLFFVGTLRARWRRLPGAEPLTAILLAAATVVVVGQGMSDSATYALSEIPGRLSPATAQAINLIGNDVLIVSAIGFFSFNLATGLAILRSRAVPRWLGWTSLALALLFVIPPIEFLGFFVLLIWTLVVSIRLLRTGSDVPEPEPEPAAVAA